MGEREKHTEKEIESEKAKTWIGELMLPRVSTRDPSSLKGKQSSKEDSS